MTIPLTEGRTPPRPMLPLPAEKSYARATGWLYLTLSAAGLFTNNLWHMMNLSGSMTVIHLAIGVTGLTVARQGGARAHRIYSLLLGFILTAWGVAGTWTPTMLSPYPLPLENALHVLTGIWGFYGAGSVFWNRFSRKS
ncbi:MAG: hypothetical protein ACYCVB_04720 [Bacilli bacterium]